MGHWALVLSEAEVWGIEKNNLPIPPVPNPQSPIPNPQSPAMH
ncbi:MAG: hypothetical protein HEQ19_30730 [Gloeotrichia echinulata CP02]